MQSCDRPDGKGEAVTEQAGPFAPKAVFDALSGREFDLTELDGQHVPGFQSVIEEGGRWTHRRPDFILNLSEKAIADWICEESETPAHYLCRHCDTLVFAQNGTLDWTGDWGCETIRFRTQFMDSYLSPSYQTIFPGPKPRLHVRDGIRRLSLDTLHFDDIEVVHEPVFLATPLEPDNWGRWVATVIQKALLYRRFGSGRRFFCRARHGWQRAVLNALGIPDERILDHDPGRTYLCHDLLTTRYSVASMVVSPQARAHYEEIRLDLGSNIGPSGKRLFVSRRSASRKRPRYRVLANEDALIGALASGHFEIYEPELHSFQDQVRTFAAAEAVACLGGAALYNVVFCRPGTRVVTLESSDRFIRPHSRLIASMGFDYGVVFGTEDPDDPAPLHKRWSLDIAATVQALDRFFTTTHASVTAP